MKRQMRLSYRFLCSSVIIISLLVLPSGVAYSYTKAAQAAFNACMAEVTGDDAGRVCEIVREAIEVNRDKLRTTCWAGCKQYFTPYSRGYLQCDEVTMQYFHN